MWVGLGLSTLPIGAFCWWFGADPWFRKIVSVGFALFVCALMFLVWRLALQALKGLGLIR